MVLIVDRCLGQKHLIKPKVQKHDKNSMDERDSLLLKAKWDKDLFIVLF